MKRMLKKALFFACFGGYFIVQSAAVAGKNIDQACVALLLAQFNSTSKDFAFFNACKNGHKEVAELLIDNGAKVNQARYDGVTPLIIACQNGHEAVVQLLIDRSANVNQALKNGETPLFIACQNGHKDIAQLLIDRGAHINQAANNGMTPFIVATHKNQLTVVRLLLEKRVDLDIIFSPLHAKVGYKALEYVVRDETSQPLLSLFEVAYKREMRKWHKKAQSRTLPEGQDACIACGELLRTAPIIFHSPLLADRSDVVPDKKHFFCLGCTKMQLSITASTGLNAILPRGLRVTKCAGCQTDMFFGALEKQCEWLEELQPELDAVTA